jgi:hypothetical protein
VAEAAAHHRHGRLLQRPVGRGVDDIAGQVIADQLGVRVLSGADRVEHVALGEDAGPRQLGIEHHGGADAPL